MKKKLASILIVAIIGIVISCVSKTSISGAEAEEPSLTDYDLEEITVATQPGRAETVMHAIAQGYPDRIQQVEARNNDWAVLIDGTWYYYANGKMLPEHRLEYASEYRYFGFYEYPTELPPWQTPSEEAAARFRYMRTSRSTATTSRAPYFLNALWQAPTRAEAESRLVNITFLGRSARVHQAIQENLRLVETRINALAQMEPDVRRWINSLSNRIESYNWRNIADTGARSYHSYGIAIDLLPRALGRMQTYWLWTADNREDWWNVPYTERYHPPDSVVKAFETYGFIWGGKWLLFDTMHFEYRPELLILNGLYRD